MRKKLQTRKRRLMRKAMIAPTICTAINPPTLVQCIPENVLVKLLAIVTAGLANEVDEVNQYAEVIKKAMASGAVAEFFLLESEITEIKPNVAIPSEIRNLNSPRS
jgi:hypothetical protein